MMEAGLSERWILLADVTNSTHFFWELKEAGRQKPNALFKSSSLYSGHMEAIFNMVANGWKNWIEMELGNTMGDGFILVGRHGHGMDHIRQDAPRVLELAREVKTECDSTLSRVKDSILEILEKQDVPRQLPDLKMKVTLHHGYLVTMMQSQRFFGDTVNYCARVASAAFKDWNAGVVLTKEFVDVLPESIRSEVSKLSVPIEIRYPKKEIAKDKAYRIDLSNDELWARNKALASLDSRI
jgi:class 3 adenylate cyclase